MKHIPAMVDMRRTAEEASDAMSPKMPCAPEYPYGLCISLSNDELAKLDLDTSDVEAGDMVHLFCMAKVTSINKRDTTSGVDTRIEMQITHIACEDEDGENEEESEPRLSKTEMRQRMYKK